jgi:hypothetical protein
VNALNEGIFKVGKYRIGISDSGWNVEKRASYGSGPREDQRVVVDAASNSQARRLMLDANHFHLAEELDIALTLVKALPRHRQDALETVAQIDGLTHQTVESGAAQILGFAFERL